MKVMDAVDQAQLARQLIDSVDALEMNDVTEAFAELTSYLDSRQADPGVVFTYRNTLEHISKSFHPNILDNDFVFHPNLEKYIEELSKEILIFMGLISNAVDAVSHALLENNTTLRNRAVQLFSDVELSMNSVRIKRLQLNAFVSAWESFDTPNDLEPSSHSIVFDSYEDTPNLELWKKLINEIDGFFVAILVIENSIEGIEYITIERIEAGSVGINLKDIPNQWWEHIFNALYRVFNKRNVELDNMQKGTETVTLAAEALAKLNKMRRNGEIDEDEYQALKARLTEVNNLDLGAAAIKVDGTILVGDQTQTAALQAPRQHLALASGENPTPANPDS